MATPQLLRQIHTHNVVSQLVPTEVQRVDITAPWRRTLLDVRVVSSWRPLEAITYYELWLTTFAEEGAHTFASPNIEVGLDVPKLTSTVHLSVQTEDTGVYPFFLVHQHYDGWPVEQVSSQWAICKTRIRR